MRRIRILSLAVLFWTADLLAADATTRPSEVHPWCQQQIVEAYEKVGSRDPAWDADAREVLSAMARTWSRDMTRTRDEEDRIWFAARRAIAAGCDDPLVLYQRARNLDFWHEPEDRLLEAHGDAADLMRDSDYHPIFKFYAYARAAQFQSQMKDKIPGAQDDARELFDEAIGLLPQIVADPQVPRRRLSDVMDILHDVGHVLDGDFVPAMQKGLEIFDAHCPDRSTNLALRAQFLVKYAWQARGRGYANTVTEEGWRLMAERLEQAAQAAEEAWELDPTNHIAAITMLAVELGQGQGLKRMRTWFKRATETDPTAYEPYQRALYYLEPKWHGSALAMVRFGKLAMKMGNWEAPGTYALVKAHTNLAGYLDREGEPRAYFLNNKQAWQGIQSFYEGYLRRVPESLYYRTEYAKLAAWCGQWEEAERQFQIMGDRFSFKAMGNETNYRKLREEVKANLNPPATAPATAPTTRPS